MFGILISTLVSLLVPICLLFLFPLGIKLFIVLNDRKKMDSFYINMRPTLLFHSSLHYAIGEQMESGFVLNRLFIGYIHIGRSQYMRQADVSTTLYLITTDQLMTILTKPQQEASTKKPIEVDVIERDGNFSYLYYNSRNITISADFTARPNQKNIMSEIIKHYKSKNYASAFIYGKSGSGKTSLGLLLALVLKGTLCTTFDPSQPGDTLQKLMKCARPTSRKPLVIILDEADVIIKNIHNGLIKQHKDIPTAMYDKRTFNKFFDDLFLFTNTIVIMTLNTSKEDIDLLDVSYLREKRVDVCYNL